MARDRAGAFVDRFERGPGAALAELGVEVEIDAEEDGGTVVVHGLSVPPPRRRGLGTAALMALCAAADRDGVRLRVVPEPVRILVDDPIPVEALRRFYAAFGFRPGADGAWGREPAPAGSPVCLST